jgi:hypothetical protein
MNRAIEVETAFSDLPPVYYFIACTEHRNYTLNVRYLLNLAKQESKYEIQKRLIARAMIRLARQRIKENGPEVQALRTAILGIS